LSFKNVSTIHIAVLVQTNITYFNPHSPTLPPPLHAAHLIF
jgi:hypothetical protein